MQRTARIEIRIPHKDAAYLKDMALSKGFSSLSEFIRYSALFTSQCNIIDPELLKRASS